MHPFQPVSDPLTMPVGALAAHNDPVQVGASVRAAAHALADSGLTALPVASGRRVAGLIDENALHRALALGIDPDSPVERVMDDRPELLPQHATGADALRAFETTGRRALIVVDEALEVVGVLTPSRLFHRPAVTYRPQIVGGLATPFGVYLTNGVVSGGARGFALAAAGMYLFGLVLVSSFFVLGFVHLFRLDVGDRSVSSWMEVASTLLFLVGLRVAPLAGTHGAEHMVVHAIERGEPLIPEVVRRMPRVHPRCGTNLAAGALIFIGLFQWEWTPYADVRALVAAVATLFLWQPVGSLLQYVFTTKAPNDAQLASGIRAGRELLAASAAAPRLRANAFQRLVSGGIFHVIAGATVASLVVRGVLDLLSLPDSWRVLL